MLYVVAASVPHANEEPEEKQKGVDLLVVEREESKNMANVEVTPMEQHKSEGSECRRKPLEDRHGPWELLIMLVQCEITFLPKPLFLHDEMDYVVYYCPHEISYLRYYEVHNQRLLRKEFLVLWVLQEVPLVLG